MKKSIIKRALCAVLCTVLATTLLFGATPAIKSEAATSRKPITGRITKAERVAVDKIKVTVKLNNKKAKVKYRDIHPSEMGKYFDGRVCIQYTFLDIHGKPLKSFFNDNSNWDSKAAKVKNLKNGTFSVTIRDKRFQKMRKSKDIRVGVYGRDENSGINIKNEKKVTYDKRKFKVVKKLVCKAHEGAEYDGDNITRCYACNKDFKTFEEFGHHCTLALAKLRREHMDLDPVEFFELLRSLRNSTKCCADPKHAIIAVGSEIKEDVYDYIWKKK